MIAIGLLLLVPFVMWCGQSFLLRLHGLPIRYRLDSGDAPRAVRTWGRVITQGSILALIMAYPLLVQGQSPIEFYGWPRHPPPAHRRPARPPYAACVPCPMPQRPGPSRRLPQAVEQRREVLRILRACRDVLIRDVRGVEHVTRGTGSVLGGAIAAIAGQRMTQLGEDRADLVQEAGYGSHFDERRVCEHTVFIMSAMGSVRHADWGLAESYLNEKDGVLGAGRDAPTIGRDANTCL